MENPPGILQKIMLNLLHCTNFGSGIIGTVPTRMVLIDELFLAKSNCVRTAWHVAKYNVRLEELRKSWSVLNRY